MLSLMNELHIQVQLLTTGVSAELPWIMLMTGANCFSQDYSVLEHQLASRGYLVAVADQLHPLVPPFTNVLARECHCLLPC